MSSPDENTGRLVWITEAQRDAIDALQGTAAAYGWALGIDAGLRRAVVAFDAAPADPAEAVREALNQPHGFDNDPGHLILDRQTRAVLVALGANEPRAGDET